LYTRFYDYICIVMFLMQFNLLKNFNNNLAICLGKHFLNFYLIMDTSMEEILYLIL